MKKNKKLTFEDALNQLEKISSDIDSNNMSVDELVIAFKKGKELSDYCKNKLDKAKLKIEEIIDVKNLNQ